ncbi:MAG: hypothetical protein WC665_02295 [Sulfurimonas sp.]|jgi:hypothetical protein
MNVFNVVLEQMKNVPLNGHAVRNIENIKSLTIAKEEIEGMFTRERVHELTEMNYIEYNNPNK